MDEANILRLHTVISKQKPNSFKDEIFRCPFCEEELLKDENKDFIIELREGMAWIKNKYPVFPEDVEQSLIIETLNCTGSLETYSLEYASSLFAFILECRDKLKKSGMYQEVIFFKNHGKEAGGSIAHSHSQFYALKNKTYDYRKIEESVKGPVVIRNREVEVTLSETTRSEMDEFNVIWEKETQSNEYVFWIQAIVRYLKHFRGGYQSYNLMLHETPSRYIMKVMPRKATTIHYLGYGLKIVPNDLQRTAEDLYQFSKQIEDV